MMSAMPAAGFTLHDDAGMSPLELAAGAPFGLAEEVTLPAVTSHPLTALEDAVTPAVHRTPCCVAFSGGRDSSLVLAAAARAAARHGCAPPIPVTLRFEGSADTEEERWQALVLDHLGLDNQVVIDLSAELDLVGPVARAELLRRGPLFPPNSHALVPLGRYAAGGCLLVGAGGDQLLGGYRWRELNDLLAGRRRPEPRDLARLALAMLPGSARARWFPRRERLGPPRWLTSAGAAAYTRGRRSEGDEPIRFDRAVRHELRFRQLRVSAAGLQHLSPEARIEAPLLAPGFVSALANAGGARGWGSRSAVMRAIATGALPDELLNRIGKARFDAVFLGDASRRFAEEWSGDGFDPAIVDGEALRREWLDPDPDFRVGLPLQVAWLHDHGSDSPSSPSAS
jgi:asparagine synthase (glutamine-hydrolysing)